MTSELLQQLEQKVTHAVDMIEFLRLQVEELEMENHQLKHDQDKWRHDLLSLLKRLDSIDTPASHHARPRAALSHAACCAPEEEFMTI